MSKLDTSYLPLVFTKSALDCIRKISPCLSNHFRISNKLKSLFHAFEYGSQSKQILSKIKDADQATKLVVNYVVNFCLHNFIFVIDDNIVLNSLTKLIRECILEIYYEMPTMSDLNGYPIYVLSQVSGAPLEYCHMCAEIVKQYAIFVQTSNSKINTKLLNSTFGFVPLSGHHNSPLNGNEVTALLDYLGTKRKIYIELLLNTLYDMYHSKIIKGDATSPDDFIIICNSPWMSLLLAKQ